MSVAVLHSTPVAYGSMFAPNAAPSKRPKLSLNTSTTAASPYRSKQSTSLRLETLSATSPTARNTFGNAYTHAARPATPLRRDSARPDTPVEKAILVATSSPVSSTCEIEPRAEIIPYTLSYDVNPILRNGPRERRPKTWRSASQSKPIFSLTKRVIFRAPLTEDIKNEQYTLRHSDIDISTGPAVQDENEGLTTLDVRTRPHLESREDTLQCPVTPVAGRNKKDRHWYWTLGPDRAGGGSGDQDDQSPATPVDADEMS